MNLTAMSRAGQPRLNDRSVTLDLAVAEDLPASRRGVWTTVTDQGAGIRRDAVVQTISALPGNSPRYSVRPAAARALRKLGSG
jgi:hypothetical protein